MNRPSVRAALSTVAAGLLAVFAVACGSSDDSTSAAGDTKTLAFEITDAGCNPQNAKAPAGPISFDVTGGSDSITELEILDGETILGEKENLTGGLTGSFSLTLEEGEYTVRCNNAEEEDGTLTVSGTLSGEISPEVNAAIAQYRGYLEENTTELVVATRPFVAAVLAGNVAEAKRLYAPARIPYERIEPVAESFGDLDPRIDARENDVAAKEWSGFHVIEQALWVAGSTEGMTPFAKQLLADIEELQAKVKTVDLQAVQIANGANELLGEVSASKITGEEERYSHIDLVDFEGNVEGAEAAFEAVKPLLTDPALAKEIEAGFDAVYASLDPYREGDGFVLYGELSKADTRTLAIGIDSLAELLAEMPVQIAGGEA